MTACTLARQYQAQQQQQELKKTKQKTSYTWSTQAKNENDYHNKPSGMAGLILGRHSTVRKGSTNNKWFRQILIILLLLLFVVSTVMRNVPASRFETMTTNGKLLLSDGFNKKELVTTPLVTTTTATTTTTSNITTSSSSSIHPTTRSRPPTIDGSYHDDRHASQWTYMMDATTIRSMNRSSTFLPTNTNTNTNTNTTTFGPSSSNNNNNNNNNKRLYVCGWQWPNLAQAIFPDYTFKGQKKTKKAKLQPHDILVYGSFGPTCAIPHTPFPGKVLYINGEKKQQPLIYPNEYQIGLQKDDDDDDDHHHHSIRVYFGIINMIDSYPPSLWARILDPTQRPKSTLEHRAVIYTATNCQHHRQQAAKDISTIIPIVYGGRCTSTSVLASQRGTPLDGGNVFVHDDNSTATTTTTTATSTSQRFTGWDARGHYMQNYVVYSKFQFCLVMENTKLDGYITEKIILAYLAGCFPIYYGTKEIFDIFHPQSFLYYNVKRPQRSLQVLHYLYTNQTAFQQRMNQPILRNGTDTIQRYFSLTDDVGQGHLKRRIRTMMGLL